MVGSTTSPRVPGLFGLLAAVSQSMAVTLLTAAVLTGPVLLYVAVHARLADKEYELTRLHAAEARELDRQSRVSVALEQATAPQRVHAQAEQMGLIQYSTTDLRHVSTELRPATADSRATGEGKANGRPLHGTLSQLLCAVGLEDDTEEQR